MVVRLNRDGEVTGEFFPRSDFPQDLMVTHEGPEWGGWVSFGLVQDLVWLWLPAGRRLVTMKKNGTTFSTVQTGLPTLPTDDPQWQGLVEVEQCELLPSGRLLAQVFFRGQEGERGKRILYQWDQSTTVWKRLSEPTIESFSATLLAVEGNRMVCLRQVRHAWEVVKLPLP
jgi:hypothetical protein